MKWSPLVKIGAFMLFFGSEAFAASSIWKLGDVGRAWRADDGGVQFVQEAMVNDPPGDPMSPVADQQADDDYYFAGVYPSPIGTVASDEQAIERAFAGTDNSLRIHFNLDPAQFASDTVAAFSFAPFNLHDVGDTTRYGVEVSFNGNQILPEVIVQLGDLGNVITTNPFTLGSVGAVFGDGGDNVLELTGINYNGDGGGNWMGLNYHELQSVDPIPEPSSSLFLLLGLGLYFPLARRRR